MKKDIYKCVLCGKESENYDSFRTIYLDRQKNLVSGYFKPHLTENEKYHLNVFESVICTNRSICQKKQYKNSTK
jgi:hypothetical protein